MKIKIYFKFNCENGDCSTIFLLISGSNRTGKGGSG